MVSTYDFDPNHLRTYEINYELRIRNVTTDRVDITLKRKYLRRELKKDLSRPDVRYATPDFDFAVERGELDDSIESITNLVDNYDGINKDVYLRLRSRIFHVLGRLGRIPDDVSDEYSNYRGDNIIRVTALQEDLEEIVAGHQQGAMTSQATNIQPNVSGSNVPKSVPVCQWGITFDGNTSRCSVTSFLQRVEELRIARNCSLENLFQSASDLFDGVARAWFRSQSRQERFSSWDTLVSALRQDFLPTDYDDQLWQEIRCRTQGKDERVVIYVSIMENLFSCLVTPPSEQEKLRIIRRNVLPSFQPHLALQEIPDVATLTKICRSLEDAALLQKKFQPPSRTISALEPGLAYGGCSVEASTSGSRSINFQHSKQLSKDINQHRNHNGGSKRQSFGGQNMQVAEVRCWRCNQLGHVQRNCQKRTPFCHGCGRPDVIRPNCPDCSKNGGGRDTQ